MKDLLTGKELTAKELAENINILDAKYINFKKWLDKIVREKGEESTLTIKQIGKMLRFLDDMEGIIDDTIIEAFHR